jgi:hypothetical protein
MNITIEFKNGALDWEGDIMATCPFCNVKNKRVEIMDDDYITMPMLWCNNCGARAFIDGIHDDNHDYLSSPNYKPREDIKCEYTTSCYKYTFPLLKIVRVVDHKMNRYITDMKLTDEQVIEIMQNKYSKELKEKYKLKKNKDSKGNPNFNFSLPCDSYNIQDEKISYPDEIDLSHDGVYIRVLLENGKTECYWGD